MSKKLSKTKNLIIKLEGNNTDLGLDVFELAHALLAIGNIIKNSNETLQIGHKEIGVNIKPFEKGSFVIEIALFAKDNLNALLDFISKEDTQNIKALLEWIGLITTTTGIGGFSLIELVKFLKGKPKKIEKISPNEVRYTNFEDNSVTVNINVDKLYQSEEIHEHFYGGFGKILENDAVDTFKTYLKDDENKYSSNNKEDLASFKAYAETMLDFDVDEVDESEFETHLNPKRGSFEGKKDNWSFRKGDQSITATIRDKVFLNKIESGEIRPNHRDLLKVRLLEKRRIKGTEILNPTYEILQVIEYKQAKPDPTLI